MKWPFPTKQQSSEVPFWFYSKVKKKMNWQISSEQSNAVSMEELEQSIQQSKGWKDLTQLEIGTKPCGRIWL